MASRQSTDKPCIDIGRYAGAFFNATNFSCCCCCCCLLECLIEQLQQEKGSRRAIMYLLAWTCFKCGAASLTGSLHFFAAAGCSSWSFVAACHLLGSLAHSLRLFFFWLVEFYADMYLNMYPHMLYLNMYMCVYLLDTLFLLAYLRRLFVNDFSAASNAFVYVCVCS